MLGLKFTFVCDIWKHPSGRSIEVMFDVPSLFWAWNNKHMAVIVIVFLVLFSYLPKILQRLLLSDLYWSINNWKLLYLLCYPMCFQIYLIIRRSTFGKSLAPLADTRNGPASTELTADTSSGMSRVLYLTIEESRRFLVTVSGVCALEK